LFCILESSEFSNPFNENIGVLDQHVGDQQVRDPDRHLKWVIGVLVALLINLISGFIFKIWWACIPPGLFIVALAAVVPKRGFLRQERQGGTRWARYVALVALAIYLVVAYWASVTRWPPTPVMILSVAFLWGVGLVLIWSTVLSRRRVSEVAIGTSVMLLALASSVIGVMILLREGGAKGYLLGFAFLVWGLGGCCTGSGFFSIEGERRCSGLGSYCSLWASCWSASGSCSMEKER
jgi:hypothetical protein